MVKKTNKALLEIWKRRQTRRKKALAKLLDTNTKLNVKKIERAEYLVVVANKMVKYYTKKVNKRKPSVHKPKVQVNRIRFGNVHGRLNPSVVVLHSTESHDRPGTEDVEAVLKYLEDTPEALGVHFVTDKEGNLGQGARINQLVYHAKGANSISVGIEQIGFAHHTHWNRIDRTPQIEKVAKTLAYISKERGIPLRHSTTHGVALHRDFPLGHHTDPGESYPLSRVLRLARRFKKTGW